VACASAALLSVVCSFAVAAPLQINSLGTTNPIAIEHDSITGDDRGGIAVGSSIVIYTGDSSSGRFSKTDLSGGTALGVQFDSITSDVGSGVIWSLGSNATTPLPFGGGTATHLLRHNPTTGLLDGTALALSPSIALASGSAPAGIFAGNGVIAVVDGNIGAISRIDTSTGQATPLGTVDATAWSNAMPCESWARWGVLEDFGGQQYLTYANGPFPVAGIVRYRISDGAVSSVASFAPPGLSDACSFSISPATNRWYVHYEGTGIFRSGDETLAAADMIATFTPGTVVTNVPTLSEWAIGALGAALALAALAALRGRRIRRA
jgi:hypothetical protein